MVITKEISKDNELYIYMNGTCIYKKWLDGGYSKVFDVMAYDSYTYASYTDLELENTEHLIHVQAKVWMKSAEEGGRETGFPSGFKCTHVFEYEEGKMLHSFTGDIQLEHTDLFIPGDSHEVRVRFLFHHPIEKYLQIGRKWWIHEGEKLIGEGIILAINLPGETNMRPSDFTID